LGLTTEGTRLIVRLPSVGLWSVLELEP